MTQKEANILVEIITKVVRKELNSFKKQLLTEGQTTVSGKKIAEVLTKKPMSMESTFRSNVKSAPRPRKAVSNDPVLNSILMDTISITEAERQAGFLNEDLIDKGLNLPTAEHGGLMATNKNVDHVLEAMNRDYSGMFKKQSVNHKPSPVDQKSQLRSKFMGMMENDYTTDNSNDDEDLSWLNEVG